MKKIYTIAIAFSISLTSLGQVKSTNIGFPEQPMNPMKKVSMSSVKNSLLTQKTTSVTSNWFNYVDFLDIILPTPTVGNFMPLFPDSTIILGFTSTGDAVNPFIHKAAHYLDPSFLAIPSIPNKSTTYIIDSVAFGYAYERHSAPSITDSVIVELIAENHSLDYTLTGPPAFPYQDIEYNYLTNKLKPSMTVLKRVGVALTELDSTNSLSLIKIAVPGVPAQTNSKKIGTVISFKPGYTWTAADTLFDNHSKNIFWLFSVEQNGDNTDPTVYGTASDYTTDMNMSYVLGTDARYNISSTGWNGYMIPTYGFTTPFAYESHYISYRLSVNNVGVNELERDGFSLSQNSPNPFIGSSLVTYQLIKDSKDVIFTITDISGRIVSSSKESGVVGSHSINVELLNAGVYFYTLNVDGNTVTKKMIVQ